MLLCITKSSKKEQLQLKVINKGSEALEDEFNYKKIIERWRLSIFETKIHDLKNHVNYNEYKQDYVIMIKSQGEIKH